jgi:hypothetical protein
MRKLFIIALLGMLCGSAFGAANGSCTGTTSCTLSGTPTATSLQIMFAYRSGSTTAPSNPAGYTSVSTGTGTTSSWRVSCRVSATALSGTATNATNVVEVWYSGTDANATANCNTTGIGSFSGTSAASSATVSYPTRALTIPNNMVLGFMGGAGSSVCTPSGMTQIATLGTVLAADTVQPTSSWPTTTCSVTAENNSGVSVEVMMTNDGLSGQSTSVWPVDYYIDMQGNTTLANDTTPLCTTAVCTPMVNGTHTIKANTWSASNAGTLTGLNVSRFNNCPRSFDYFVRGDKLYPKTRPWRSIRIDHGTKDGTGAATGINAQISIPANTPNVSMTGCIYIGAMACDGGQTLVDFIQPQGALTGRSSTVQFDCGQGFTPAQPAFNVESNLDGTTKHGNYVRVKPGTSVRFAFYVDYTTGLQKAKFWDPWTLAFIGESSIQVTVTPETVGNINVGNTEFYTTASCTGCNGVTNISGNTYSYIEDIGIDVTNASYPPLPTEQTPWWKAAAAAIMIQRRQAGWK